MANNNVPINDKIDYNKIFCDAVDTIISKRLENLSFDNTVTAEIIDATNAEFGHYVVREKDITYDVMSENYSYKVGDKVYVTIPSGDYNKTKVILSEYKDKEQLAALQLVRPKDIQISETLKTDNTDTAILNLIANGKDLNDTSAAIIYELNQATYTQMLLCDSLILQVDVKCNLRATYRYIFSGEYGLKILLRNGDEGIETEIGRLDFSTLVGDPYLYPSYFTQYLTLDLRPIHEELKETSQIVIRSFETDNFKYKDEIGNIYSVEPIAPTADTLQLVSQAFGGVGASLAQIEMTDTPINKNICFKNLTLSIGFNITQKNNTFNLYAARVNDSYQLLPVWCHYDTNGNEIKYNDNNILNYNNFYTRADMPFNAYWGDSVFRSWNVSAPNYDEKTYNKHLQALQSYNKNKVVALQEFNSLVEQDTTGNIKKLIDTKEFLSLYMGHKTLQVKIKDWINGINQYFDFLQSNVPSKYLSENIATPDLLSDTTISTGAQCQMTLFGGYNEGKIKINISCKVNSNIETPNVLYLTFKYPKQLFDFRTLQSVSNDDDVNPQRQTSVDNLNNNNIWNNSTNKFLYYIILDSTKIDGLNDTEEMCTLIYYNRNGILDTANSVELIFNDALKSISDNIPITLDYTPITLIGTPYPDTDLSWAGYIQLNEGSLPNGQIPINYFYTCMMSKRNEEFNSLTTAFARQFSIKLSTNDINLDNFHFDNVFFDTFIPVYADIKNLYKRITEVIKTYKEESNINQLKLDQPWVTDSHNYLSSLLTQTALNDISWDIEGNKIALTEDNWSNNTLIYCLDIWSFYQALSEYCHELLQIDTTLIGYCPSIDNLIAWDNIVAEMKVKWDALSALRDEILSYIYYYMQLDGYGYNDTIGAQVTLDQINGYSDVSDFIVICREIDKILNKDFEFEFSKFLTFFSNHYYILGYQYSNISNSDNGYLLSATWQIDENLTANLNNFMNVTNVDKLLVIPLSDDYQNVSIRAILFYNHIAYKSNIITLDTLTDDTTSSETTNFSMNNQLPLFNSSNEIIGYINGNELIDFIDQYRQGVGGEQ